MSRFFDPMQPVQVKEGWVNLSLNILIPPGVTEINPHAIMLAIGGAINPSGNNITANDIKLKQNEEELGPEIQPGDVREDGRIFVQGHGYAGWHEYGFHRVTPEQAEAAKKHGWKVMATGPDAVYIERELSAG